MARKLINVRFVVDEGPGPDNGLVDTWTFALETILEDYMTIPTRIEGVEAEDDE